MWSCAWCSAATGRSCARSSAMREPACPCSRSTSARSASWRRSSPTTSRRHPPGARAATSSCCACRGSCSSGERDRGDRDQRRRDPPQGRRAGRRARLRPRRRGGRKRALRRARGGDAGGVDRLQPRQRRARDGVGGGGVRGVVHRAHSMSRARAGGRARRPADDLQPLARAAGRGGGRAPGRRDPAGGTIDASFVDDVGTLAQLPGSSFYRRLREKFGRLAS